MKITKIPLSDLFSFERGNGRLTRKECHDSGGNMPVYTAAIGGPAWFYDHATHEGPLLTYTMDGVNAGTTEVLHGSFCLGGHRGALVLKPEHPWGNLISLEFVSFVMEAKFKALVRNGSVPSLTWGRIKSIELPIPLDSKGSPDVDIQQEYAAKCSLLKSRQREIARIAKRLADAHIDPALDDMRLRSFSPSSDTASKKQLMLPEKWTLDTDTGLHNIPLSDIVNYHRGRSITRKVIAENPGPLPVWTADNKGPVGHVSTTLNCEAFQGPALTLSRNGVGGRVAIVEGEQCPVKDGTLRNLFTVNEDRFVLIPKSAYKDCLDLEYLALRLEPLLRESCKGRRGPNGETEFTKVSYAALDNIVVPYPLNPDGSLDLLYQREYVARLTGLNLVQKTAVDELTAVAKELIEIPLV